MATNNGAVDSLQQELIKARKNYKKSTWDKKEQPGKRKLASLVKKLKS